MSYIPVQIDRKKLTIMGVSFPDHALFESASNAIGSNMFEGFVPTENSIRLIRDYLTGSITLPQFLQAAREKKYE
jgi:hypothetical protein